MRNVMPFWGLSNAPTSTAWRITESFWDPQCTRHSEIMPKFRLQIHQSNLSTQAQLPTVAVHLQFNSSPFKTERLFGSLTRSYMLFRAPVCKLLFEMAILMLIFRHWRRSVQLRIQMFKLSI